MMAKKETNAAPTISEIRAVLKAMLVILKSRAATIPDGAVRRAKLAKLNAIAEESHQTDDVEELLEYAISAIAIMKCSIEAAKFSLQATLVDLALDGLLSSDDEELRRVSKVRTV
jgi:hypothetical protein